MTLEACYPTESIVLFIESRLYDFGDIDCAWVDCPMDQLIGDNESTFTDCAVEMIDMIFLIGDCEGAATITIEW